MDIPDVQNHTSHTDTSRHLLKTTHQDTPNDAHHHMYNNMYGDLHDNISSDLPNDSLASVHYDIYDNNDIMYDDDNTHDTPDESNITLDNDNNNDTATDNDDNMFNNPQAVQSTTNVLDIDEIVLEHNDVSYSQVSFEDGTHWPNPPLRSPVTLRPRRFSTISTTSFVRPGRSYTDARASQELYGSDGVSSDTAGLTSTSGRFMSLAPPVVYYTHHLTTTTMLYYSRHLAIYNNQQFTRFPSVYNLLSLFPLTRMGYIILNIFGFLHLLTSLISPL